MTPTEPPEPAEPFRPTPLPVAPPTRPGELRPSRDGDTVTAWILWALLLGGCVLAALIMLLAGINTSLECSSGASNVGEACSGRPADVAQAGAFGTLLTMFVAVVASLVLVIVRTKQARVAWVWPAAGIVAVVLAFAVWAGAYGAVT